MYNGVTIRKGGQVMSKKGENITKRKDGRWEARIIKGRDCSGKAMYKYLYALSYKDVRQKKNDYIKNQQACANKKSDILLDSLFTEFLAYKRHEVKESTYARYQEIINVYLSPAFNNIKVNELSSQHISEFMNTKLNAYRKKRGGELSAKRKCDILSVLKLVLKFGLEEGYCDNTPRVVNPKNTTSEPKIMNSDEQSKLINCVLASNEQQQIGIVLALCTGLRIGELCALTWNDMNLDENYITVSKTIQRIPNCEVGRLTKILIGQPKSKSSCRVIPIPSLIRPYLLYFKNSSSNKQGYILTGTDKYIEPSNYYSKYQKWLSEYQIERYSFHSLRHAFATRCISCGFDVKTLSEILGHANIKTTLSLYVHSSIEQKAINMAKLSDDIRSHIKRQ